MYRIGLLIILLFVNCLEGPEPVPSKTPLVTEAIAFYQDAPPVQDSVDTNATPSWLKESAWHMRAWGERQFPRDKYDEVEGMGDWNAIIEEIILPLDPPFIVVWTGGPDVRYSKTELERLERVRDEGIRTVGYLSFGDYAGEGEEKREEALEDKIDYLINDLGLDGIWIDGWIMMWENGDQYPNPFFNEGDQCDIYRMVKSKKDNVLIMSNDISYISSEGIKEISNGETWMFDCLDGVDWENYGEDLYKCNMKGSNYETGWLIVNATMGLSSTPKWTAGISNYQNRCRNKFGPLWYERVPEWTRTVQGQGFSVFASGPGREADDGVWDWESWYGIYFP